MNPTSLGQRLGAYIIDVIVLLPVGLISIAATFVSARFGIVLHLLFAPTAFLYATYFISQRGQTIGKRVLKIKVVKLDGSSVGVRDAILRGLIDLLFAVALSISSFGSSIAALARQNENDHELGLTQVIEILNAGQNEASGQMISVLSVVYAVAQLICFFATSERRFIHDFVANTRVIQLKPSNDDAAFAAN